ncbi:MAG TPA: enoyl-CoA hydratase/isomerase family protein [Firmicutes bacterium]|nr:enoyl-CoA hydratase/isomerase family protein [Bacillota bacterium]
MAWETLLLEKKGNIGIITLNRPDKMNTMTPLFIKEYNEVLDKVSLDPEVRVVILQAKGKAFCAGGDFELLKALDTAPKARFTIREIGKAIAKMYHMPKPIIAAVQGAAAGGGANLALSCDFVIASEKARFGQAFVNIGLVPDTGGMWSLTRAVGVMRAKELAMTGRLIGAKEAESYGMVLKVVPVDELEQEVMAFAQQLAAQAPIAVGYIKQIANRISDITQETYADLEADLMGIALQTEDHKEGLAAFLEKRKPVFKGK